MILNIAWRNIWRNKVRSLVVILSIAVGLWAGIFVMAFSFGMYQGYIKEVIRYQVSHIQVHHPRFSHDKDVRDSIPDAAAVVNMIRKHPLVKQVVLRSRGQGMIMSPSNSYGIMLSGIDPVEENRITDLSLFIEEGNYLPDSGGKQILLGWKLAKKLKAGIKSKVVIMMQGSDGEIVSGAYRVAGIFRTKNTTFDERNVIIRRSDFNDLIGAGPVAHEIAMLLNDETAIGEVQSMLQTTNPGLKTENYRELNPELDLVIESFNQYMYIFIGIILLALMFGIINTQLMAVLERQRELGMLMAIGMNKIRLFSMIMMETVFLAITGGPMGILLSYSTISWLQVKGINLSFFSEGLALRGFSNMVYPYLEPDRYWPVLFMTIGVAVISAIYPAYKALKLNPSEAIRKI
jgi:putative ABC transport system permease protein